MMTIQLTRTSILRAAILAACSIATVTVGGCYGALGGELIREGQPTGTLRIINGSNTTITSVLISECRAASYGLNRLPSGQVMQPGQSWNVTVSAGCYDVMMGYGTATGYAAATQRLDVAIGRVTSFTATGR
jgi:hypothetical protein